MNSNPLPINVACNSMVNAVKVSNKTKALKVTMTRLYDMLVQYGH